MKKRPDNAAETRAPIQLKMNFSGENPLAETLRAGRFLILVEQNSPPREQPFESATAQAVAVAKRAATLAEVTGMAVTDRQKAEDSHDPVDTASLLADNSAKPCLMTLSGKGSNRERLRDALARAASRGIRNILAVTGDRSDRHALRRSATGRITPYPAGYHDSVSTLRLIHSSTTGLYAGAGVNPFKYNAADQYLQYYKMLRKMASGANFLVTHAGWDMKKLQELQWFLQMRELSWPVLARIPLLSPQDIAVIHDGFHPGVHTARLFYAMLQRESNVSPTQCLAAQLTRVGLQVAGCRLLGYSGVQLTGIRDVKLLEMAAGKIREALDQYKTYPDWLAAWNEFHNFIDFAPHSNSFYAFDHLMQPDCQHYNPDTCTLSGKPWPEPRFSDRCRSFSLKWMLSSYAPEWLQKTARVAACRNCDQTAACAFAACYYLCPEACPKGLAYGACGGSQPDGTCEFGHAPCFHHRILALAAKRHELDTLEEGVGEA